MAEQADSSEEPDKPFGIDARGARGMQFGPYSTQNNIFYQPSPAYRLDPFTLSPPPDPGWSLRIPSRLLDARAEVVDFTGREAELRDLAQWRDGPAGLLAARLVHGVGGQGKTRLANRFAVQSAQEGWRVLTARHNLPAATADTRHGPSAAPDVGKEADRVLIIVDYADRWPHTQLVLLFSDPVLRGARRPRVLLIGRSVQWWPAIRGELADLHAEGDERRLKSLSATVADRERLFRAARDRFAALLAPVPHSSTPPGSPAGDEPTPDAVLVPAALSDLGNRAYDTVLTVHMAALVAVYTGPSGAPLADRPEALAAFLLDREHTTWQRLFDTRQPSATRPRQFSRVVFVATLTGALAHRAALDALNTAALEPAQSLLDDHRTCYPPFDPGTVLEPLSPDRLAEDFLALSLPGHDAEGYDPDPWTRDAVTALLTRGSNGTAPAYTARSVTFLAAAAARWPHVAAVVGTLLRDDPGLAVDAGSPGLQAVAETPGLDTDTLDAVVARFPATRQVDLDAGMAAVVDRRARELLDTAAHESARIAVLLDPEIPLRLINAGRFEDAVNALRTSIPWWRKLAGDAHNARFLAAALNMLSTALAFRGQFPEALEAARESVELYRRWDPDSSDLASALVTYSGTLLALRRPVDAAQAATAAAQLYLDTKDRDEVTSANLAVALGNQSRALATVGRIGPALQATDAELELWQALAAAQPRTFEPALAAALNSAALLWASTGDRQRALQASQESTAIHRRMDEVNPAAHRSALSGVLTNLGRDLAAVGRYSEALDASLEAVALCRGLAAHDPAAHDPDLARALNNLSSRLGDIGRVQESLDAIREAVSIQSELAAAAPDTHEPELANLLTNLGEHLNRGGQSAQALPFLRKAVAIRRRLAADGIAAHQADLAHSIERLAAVYAATGRIEDSVDAATEAVDGYRQLTGTIRNAGRTAAARGEADVHAPALSRALMTLHQCLRVANRPEQALNACEQSVHLLLSLAATDPQRFEPDLAASLTNLSGALADVGRHAEASGSAQKAVLIYRRLAEQDPARHNRRLATAHHNLAVALSPDPDARHHAAAGTEAVKDLRRLSESDPGFAPDLAMALGKLSIALIALGRWNDAFATVEQAVTLRRRLASADPAIHEPHLARLLHGLAAALLVADVAPAQAAAMARESLATYRRLADRDPAAFRTECHQATTALTALLRSNGVDA